jgi:hypothetical protein
VKEGRSIASDSHSIPSGRKAAESGFVIFSLLGMALGQQALFKNIRRVFEHNPDWEQFNAVVG